MKYFKGQIATKDQKENFIEENVSFFYNKKESNSREKINLYHDVIISEKEKGKLEKLKGIVHNFSASFELENYAKIYSDGASFNNGFKDPSKPQFGSYGTVVLQNEKEIIRLSKAERDWTNNIGEISGVIAGLDYIIDEWEQFDRPKNIFVVSDSQYVIKGCTEWMYNWKKNKWRNNTKQEIANRKLWEKLDYDITTHSINAGYTVYFKWVRGHTLLPDQDSMFNEICDFLATDAIANLKKLI